VALSDLDPRSRGWSTASGTSERPGTRAAGAGSGGVQPHDPTHRRDAAASAVVRRAPAAARPPPFPCVRCGERGGEWAPEVIASAPLAARTALQLSSRRVSGLESRATAEPSPLRRRRGDVTNPVAARPRTQTLRRGPRLLISMTGGSTRTPTCGAGPLARLLISMTGGSTRTPTLRRGSPLISMTCVTLRRGPDPVAALDRRIADRAHSRGGGQHFSAPRRGLWRVSQR
jgi:hypothetical protein